MLKRISTLAMIAVFCLHTLAFAHGDKPHVMGTVAAMDAQHVVVQTKEGKTISILLNRGTTYRKGEAAATGTDLKAGDRVVIETAMDGETLVAREIRFSSPGEKKDHERMRHNQTTP